VHWAGGNPLHHAQDVNRVLRAWRRPEVTIVNDFNWTATAKHADIVLPATTMLERNDIASTDTAILAMQKVVEPLYESRNDFDIFAGVADRLGVGAQYREGRDEKAWLQYLYGQAQQKARMQGAELPNFATLWRQGYAEFSFNGEAEGRVAYADFRADPESHPLKTPSGRIEIFSERIASFGYDDTLGHAIWIEPFEWLGSAATHTYPPHLNTSHPGFRLHSQLNET
jgi:molybdopterin guanine dinucleotide-containing S/N-oxide reductase-like protein